MITRRSVIYAAGGISALAALGFVGGVTNGASLLYMIPAVVLQAISALCFTWHDVK